MECSGQLNGSQRKEPSSHDGIGGGVFNSMGLTVLVQDVRMAVIMVHESAIESPMLG
jgi:hypothetical protein